MKFKWRHSFHNRDTPSNKEEELCAQTNPLSSVHTSTKESLFASRSSSTQQKREKVQQVELEQEQEEFTPATSITKKTNTNDNNISNSNSKNSLPQLITASHSLLSSSHLPNKLNETEEDNKTKEFEQEQRTPQNEKNAKREQETFHIPPTLSAEYTEPSRESFVRKTEKKSRKEKDSGTKKSSKILALKSLFSTKVGKVEEQNNNENKDKNVSVKHRESHRNVPETGEKQAVQTLAGMIDVPCTIMHVEPTVRDTTDASIDEIDQLLHHRFVAGLIPRELHGQPRPSSQSIEVASGKNVSENVNITNTFSSTTSSSLFNHFPSSDGINHESKSASGSQLRAMPSLTRATSHSLSNELADSSANGSHQSLRHVISLTDPRLRRTSHFLASQRGTAHNARERAISWNGMRKPNERNMSMHAYTVGKRDGAQWEHSLPDLTHTGQILKSTKTKSEKAHNYGEETNKDKMLQKDEEEIAGNAEMQSLWLQLSPLHKLRCNSTTKLQDEKRHKSLVERKEEEKGLSRHRRRHHGTEGHDVDVNDAKTDESKSENNSSCNECNADTPRKYSRRHHHNHHGLASSLSFSASSALPTTIFASLISPNSLLESPMSGTSNTDDERSQSKRNALNLSKVSQEKKKNKSTRHLSSTQKEPVTVPISSAETKAVTRKTTSETNTVPSSTSAHTLHHEAETMSSNANLENSTKLLASLTCTLENAVNYAEEMQQEHVVITAQQRELIDKLKSYANAAEETK